MLSWPTSTNLRDFVFSFTHYWLDKTLLPLQSAEMKWNKITIKWAHSGQEFLVPLVGKYGHYQGAQSSDKFFEVNLISSCSSKKHHYFRLRGVADDYDLFDRPERDNHQILERTNALEWALLAPFALSTGDHKDQDCPILHYVKLASPNKKLITTDHKKRKVEAIKFTAAFCVGFR